MIIILVTNDDGIYSPGLRALARALKRLGLVYVVAPDRERNAAGHALTLHKPLRAEAIGTRLFAVNGTPTDCVNLGVNKILPERPALVVSGINKGGNLGDDITYSGTVSAAMEGTLLGIPSIAVSQMGNGNYHFGTAADFTARLCRLAIRKGFPQDTFINVNVPNLPASKIGGVRITALGKRIYDTNTIVEKVDPRGKAYYWIGNIQSRWEDRKETDHQAVEEGMISVNPVHLDLTQYEAMGRLRSWVPLLDRPRRRRSR
jgi:5'-nucleotidase